MRFAQRLREWFQQNQRDLPWRRTRDPYRIWLSEIMLQQTRVTAVIPYYQRFLERFPTCDALAAAPEDELLAAWAGLGYYSRARNLRRAAQAISAAGEFPKTYDDIRKLPGVGDYTAGAVASIALGLPHVGLDGNVIRVMARVTAENGDVRNAKTRERLRGATERELGHADPGTYQQSLMELGATICLPRNPKCLICPINDICGAKLQGLESTIPIQAGKAAPIDEEKTVYWVEREGEILLWQRPSNSRRLAGFWELPERAMIPKVKPGRMLGAFKHSIVNHRYRISLVEGKLSGRVESPLSWISREALAGLAVSTVTRKGIRIVESKPAS
jgi:A/G-specific adenine glycosylase